MGKNKRSEIVYNGMEFDSKEELQFFYWLEEALANDLVKAFSYQPSEFFLSDKLSMSRTVVSKKGKCSEKEYTVLQPHIYTADFKISFTNKFIDLIKDTDAEKYFKYLLTIDKDIFLDIKGSFNRNGGDRVFSVNQKWVYQKYNVFVHKIVPYDLFNATWCPEKCRLTDKKKLVVEKLKDLRNISDFLKRPV